MENWSQAYKAIHGKTPTKKQCATLAPQSLRPVNEEPKNAKKKSPKKASLKRGIGDAFPSPAKKRRMLDFGIRKFTTLNNEEPIEPTIKENSEPTTSQVRKGRFLDFGRLQRPELSSSSIVEPNPIDNNTNEVSDVPVSAPTNPSTLAPFKSPLKESFLNSPLKNWPSISLRQRQSPRKTPQKRPPPGSLATPSPRKTIANFAAGTSSCRRLHHLLNVKTPVKGENKEPELKVFKDERPEGVKDPVEKKKYVRKTNNDNFVSLNLRKRNYVKGKPGKFNKKKFMKNKFKKFN